MVDTITIPTLRFSAEHIDTLPTWTPTASPDIEYHRMARGSSASSVRQAVMLSDASIVVRFLGDTVTRYTANGSPAWVQHVDGLNRDLHVLQGDTLIAAFSRGAGRGEVVRITRAGGIHSRPIVGYRTLIGVSSNGSWYMRQPRSRERTYREGRAFVPIIYSRLSAAAVARDTLRAGGAEILFIAESERDSVLDIMIPWDSRPEAAVLGESLWISPEAEAELIEIAPDGKIHRRILWQMNDIAYPTETFEQWASGLVEANREHPAYPFITERVASMEPPTRVPPVDEIRAGPDGLLRVGFRVPYDSNQTFRSWLVIDPEIGPVSKIRIPSSLTVFAFSDSTVLALSDSTGVAMLRSYRLVMAQPR